MLENTVKNLEHIDFVKKFDDLKKRWKSTPAPIRQNPNDQNNQPNIKKMTTENTQRQAKICPFMSTPEKNRPCGPECALYRNEKHGYECMFSAIQSISWNTGKGANSQGSPRY